MKRFMLISAIVVTLFTITSCSGNSSPADILLDETIENPTETISDHTDYEIDDNTHEELHEKTDISDNAQPQTSITSFELLHNDLSLGYNDASEILREEELELMDDLLPYRTIYNKIGTVELADIQFSVQYIIDSSNDRVTSVQYQTDYSAEKESAISDFLHNYYGASDDLGTWEFYDENDFYEGYRVSLLIDKESLCISISTIAQPKKTAL